MKRKSIIIIIVIALALGGGFYGWLCAYDGVRYRLGSTEQYYYKHGVINRSYTGIYRQDDTWWLVKRGHVDTEYEGLVSYKKNLWMVRDGRIDLEYDGFTRNEAGWWYVKHGKVQKNTPHLVYGELTLDPVTDQKGSLLSDCLAYNRFSEKLVKGWWLIEDGKVSSADTLVKARGYWWSVENGAISFSYQGIGENGNGKFYVSHGTVDFDMNEPYLQDACTYVITNGKVKGEIRSDSLKFIAHRGLNTEAPENTRKAFELAGQAGFWGCETDVRMTADGRFVLLHDKTFNRVCGEKIEPKDLTSEEIQQMQIISGSNLEEYADDPEATKVAFLEDYLRICLQYDMVPVIEIKGYTRDDEWADYEMLTGLYETCYSIMGDKEITFICFDLETLSILQSIVQEAGGQNVRYQHLSKEGREIAPKEYYDMGIQPDLDETILDTELIEVFEEHDMQLNVWTVDDPYRLVELMDQGVDYVTTNQKFW